MSLRNTLPIKTSYYILLYQLYNANNFCYNLIQKKFLIISLIVPRSKIKKEILTNVCILLRESMIG